VAVDLLDLVQQAAVFVIPVTYVVTGWILALTVPEMWRKTSSRTAAEVTAVASCSLIIGGIVLGLLAAGAGT